MQAELKKLFLTFLKISSKDLKILSNAISEIELQFFFVGLS